jgi:ADP-ribose pyrophosphatase YjhB (NUDIX family)
METKDVFQSSDGKNVKAPLNVFQPGLLRGGENLAFDPEKKYAFVQHPTEGWRVYLRSCCFVHDKPTQSSGECIDTSKFIVVKRAGDPSNIKAWEPPKGQMEYKDMVKHTSMPIMNLLKENVRREVAEESRIQTLFGLRHTGLVFQGREKDYPPNTFFQYHIFQALVSPTEWRRASQELDWYRAHPLAFARLRRDKREKDAIDWYSPSDHKLMGKWSPKIVALYLNEV